MSAHTRCIRISIYSVILGAAMGSVNCRSTSGEGTIRAENTVQKVEQIRDVIRRSNLTDDQKKNAEKLLDEITTDTRSLGHDVDTNREIADANEAAAGRWRMVLWIVGIVVVAGFCIGVKKLLF